MNVAPGDVLVEWAEPGTVLRVARWGRGSCSLNPESVTVRGDTAEVILDYGDAPGCAGEDSIRVFEATLPEPVPTDLTVVVVNHPGEGQRTTVELSV